MAAEKLRTPIGTFLYTHLFEPARAMGGGEGKYETTLVLDAAALKTAEYAAIEKAVDALRAELARETKTTLANIKSPLRDNSEREEKAPEVYTEGGKFLSAKTKFQPTVVDRAKRPITDPDAVFGGQQGRLVVSPFKYNTNGNKGVSFSLDAVQVTDSDRERVGGGGAAVSLFEELEDTPF